MAEPTVDEFQKLVRTVLREAGVRRSRTIDQLLQAWVATQTDELCQHTRITNFINGVVEVTVDSHSLLQELQAFRSADILHRLQAGVKFPVRQLRFVIHSACTAGTVAEA